MDSHKTAELAARIDALIEGEKAENRALFHAVATDERRELRRRAQALHAEKKAAQDELAAIFAERHGWKRSERPFGVGCLAAGGKHGYGSSMWPGPMINHPNWFRKDGRAAAAVGHLYGFRREWRDWARENGLKLTLSKFPSWYWPSRCRLVIYIPLPAQDPARPFRVGRSFECRLASVDGRVTAFWNPRAPQRNGHCSMWQTGGKDATSSSNFPLSPVPLCCLQAAPSLSIEWAACTA